MALSPTFTLPPTPPLTLPTTPLFTLPPTSSLALSPSPSLSLLASHAPSGLSSRFRVHVRRPELKVRPRSRTGRHIKKRCRWAAPEGRPCSSFRCRDHPGDPIATRANQHGERAERDDCEWFRDSLAYVVRHAQDGLRHRIRHA